MTRKTITNPQGIAILINKLKISDIVISCGNDPLDELPNRTGVAKHKVTKIQTINGPFISPNFFDDIVIPSLNRTWYIFNEFTDNVIHVVTVIEGVSTLIFCPLVYFRPTNVFNHPFLEHTLLWAPSADDVKRLIEWAENLYFQLDM